MQPRGRRAFRRFLKKHFAVVSILAPHNSLQIPYIFVQYPKMSNMYMLKEKQRCLVRSLVRDFSRQNGWKIQVKPKYRLQPEISNLVSRRTYTAVYSTCVSQCSNILVCTILLLAVLPPKLPDRGRAILLQQTTKFSLKKNRFNSKRRNIHKHFNAKQDNVKYL
jgi:hypothetical protein